MIGKEIDINSSGSEADEIKMMSETQPNLKHGRVDTNIDAHQRKRTRYNRHTPHQIRAMESFFKDCPHPSDKQRRDLGRELGMEPSQIKFWFQNKRNQMKTQHEHQENMQLRIMNDKLRAQNGRYREAICNAACAACGGPVGIGRTSNDELHLKMENAGLRREIDRISTIAAMYVGKPFPPQ